MRKVMCQVCREKFAKDETEVEYIGQKTKVPKYYCEKCYQVHLKQKEFKEQQRIEKDELRDTVLKAHGIKKIPNESWFFIKIEKLRDRYGNGYKFSLISHTYKVHWKDMMRAIQWKSKKVGGMDVAAEVNYGLAVIASKLETVERNLRNKEIQQKTKEIILENTDMITGYDQKKKKKANTGSHKTDISDFL